MLPIPAFMFCPCCRGDTLHTVQTERQCADDNWYLVTTCECGRTLARWYPDLLYKLAKANGILLSSSDTREEAA